MKARIALVAALVVQISGYLIKVPTTTPRQPETTPVAWVSLQKLVIPLFKNVCEDSADPTINKLAKEFVVDSTDNFSNPNVLSNLQKLISGQGLLSKIEIFTEYNPDHLYELQIIYELLYYAKSFEQFYKAASWSRQNLNCVLYINAIYMAIQHRSDTEKLSIPAPYELLPNYFITKDAILRGAYISMGKDFEESEDVHVDGDTYTVCADYTSKFYNSTEESKLAYFREDVGLNSYYFLRKLNQPPSLNADISDRYGEDIYQMMRQLLARYNLERYANGLPELDNLSWNSAFEDTYDPMLIYSNGDEFIHRSAAVEFSDNEDISVLNTIENSIETIVIHMIESGYNKTQILNHLMEILVTGDRSYETLARRLLGKDLNDNGSPSVLEHYMTSLRDPAFWKINYKIVNMVDSALKFLPSYTKNELYFPGVEITNVDVKKMMTVFDYYEIDVTDALNLSENDTTQIKIGQPRLNHKPFTIKITMSSLVSEKGLVKLFLGPKLLPGELITKKNYFFLLDQFDVNLKIGSNVITRTSNEMTQYSDDFISIKALRRKVQDAEFGLNTVPFTTIQSQTGYPSRINLPKGSPEGLPLRIFAFIAPYSKATIGEFYSVISKDFNSAILSPGYPMDLEFKNSLLFELPNALLKDIKIMHKGDNKVENYGRPGDTKEWMGDKGYDYSTWPNYTVTNKKPFDYSSKKTQHEKNDEELIKSEEDTTLEPIVVNDGYKIHEPRLKLSSTGFNWDSKRKVSFDYNSKRGQYSKKDYYKQNENTDKNSIQRDYVITKNEEKSDDDDFIVNIHKKEETDPYLESERSDQDNDDTRNIKIIQKYKVTTTSKPDLVYKYVLDDDSSDEVYEKKIV